MTVTQPTLAKLMALSARCLATTMLGVNKTEQTKRRILGSRGRLRRWYSKSKAQMRAQNFIFDSELFREVGTFMYCGIDPVTNETLWIDSTHGQLLWIPFYETELEMEFQANEAFNDPKFRFRNYTYRQLRPLTIS